MKILAVGQNIRHIAASAGRAGHRVLAADCYRDEDIADFVAEARRLDCDPEMPGGLEQTASAFIEESLESFDPDFVILGPGLEDMAVEGAQMLNNPPEKTRHVSDKLWIARWLERKGFNTIPTVIWDEADWTEPPFVIKPRRGAGGWKIRMARGREEAEDVKVAAEEEFVVQRYLVGRAASVSVVCDGKDAVALAVNEQLIGAAWLGARGFRYCGNITPLEPVDRWGMAEMAEEIVSDLGLLGSNGVDFLLTEKGPVVVEVNPRIQGSLDSVEMATGMSVFQAHLRSFQGHIPEAPRAVKTAGRAILFADSDMIIGDLRESWTADVPESGSIVKKDGPVISILAAGERRRNVMNLMQKRASLLRRRCRSF